MKKISTVVCRGFFLTMAVCLLFPCMVLSLENRSIDSLREQVEVLDQALKKVAAELSVQEEQGIATDRDREHFRTVTTLLEQRIAESCRRLAAQGGIAAVSGLSCPDQIRPAAARKQKEKKSPSSETVVRKTEEPPAKPPAVVPEATGVRAEMEDVPTPENDFWTAVRQWWESLFLKKTPASGDKTGEPEEQKTAAEEQQADARIASAQDRSVEQSGPAGGSVHPEQGGDKQRIAKELAAGREDEQPGRKAEQATAVRSATDRKPAGVDQTGKQNETAAADRKEQPAETASGKILWHADENKASPDRNQSLSGTAERKKTGRVEKAGQEQPKQGRDTLQHKDLKSATAATEAEQEHKQARAGAGVREKTETVQQSAAGAEPEPGTAAGVAGLEQSLQDALNAFDGRLLSEEERLAAHLPKQREGSAGGYGAAGSCSSSGGGMAGGSSPEGTGREQGNGRAGAGGYRQAGSVASAGTQPDTGGGGSSIDADDDIVARQLREAAEQETDPVLQEKLWQEYHKYKQDR